MYTVRLVRGSKATVSWDHETRQAAKRRVMALTDLHSCDYEEESGVFTVDASRYYG